MNDYLTTREAAKLLNVSISSVYQLRRRGLPCHKLGTRTIRYDRREIEEWMNRALDGIDTLFTRRRGCSDEAPELHSAAD